MTIIEFHPDDLLDRELRGQLTEGERVRLADHLRTCSTCRLERMMRGDFAAAAEPLRVSQGFASFVTAAITQAQAEAQRADAQPPEAHSVEPEPPVAIVSRGGQKRRRIGAVLLVAAVLGVTVAAAARTEWAERVLRAALGEPLRKAAPARRPNTARAAKTMADARGASPADAVREAEPAASPAVLSLASSGSVPAADGASLALGTPVEAPARRRATAASAGPAQVLFARATRLRRADDVDGAVAAYGELRARFPRSAEARRTPVLLGRLLLDVGRPQPALDAFDTYLAAREPVLREDALAGRARALARLGQGPAAERAFAQLLREFPRSSYAAWMERQRD